MKIEKLSSGKYRIQKMVDGKRYNLLFDHKPTQTDINLALADKITNTITSKTAPTMTFEKCAKEFMAIRENVLRTGTKRNYRSVMRNIPDDLNNMRLCDIDKIVLQKYINDLSADHSPKTVKNYYSFVHDVIVEFIPEFNIKVKLPEVQKTSYYIPTSEEVKKVMAVASDKYRPLFMLGCYGLRKEEILALNLDDFDLKECTVNICKSYVYDDIKKKWLVENYTKTKESTRIVPLDKKLIKTFLDRGYIYEGTQSRLLKHLHYCQDTAGVPRFRLHDFRHFFATELNQAGFSSKDIQALGGWSSPYIMEKIYAHERIEKDKPMQKKAAATITNLI